jgi:hypothetical protein
MEPMGVSFMPGQQDDQTKKPGSEAPQDAIKTLNLAIPRVVGGASPINASLLNAQGSAGMPANGFGGLEAFLRRLFGQMPQAGPVSPGGAPLPPAGGNGRTTLPGMEPGLPSPPPSNRRPPMPGFMPGQEAPVEPPPMPPRTAADYLSDKMDTPRMTDGFNF